jgi:hypothetical protein
MFRTVFWKSLSSVYCVDAVSAEIKVPKERREREAMLKKCIVVWVSWVARLRRTLNCCDDAQKYGKSCVGFVWRWSGFGVDSRYCVVLNYAPMNWDKLARLETKTTRLALTICT